MPEENKKCNYGLECDKPGRVAIKTTRPKRNLIKTMVWWDVRVDVPSTAQVYCKEHGIKTLASLGKILIDEG